MELMRGFKVTCELDYLQFTGNAKTVTFDWPDKHLQGHRVTLPRVRYAGLKRLPPAVLAHSVAGLELTLDLRPTVVPASEQEHLQLLWKMQNMLFRRLTPWEAPFVGERLYIYATARTPRQRLMAGQNDVEQKVVDGHSRSFVRDRSSAQRAAYPYPPYWDQSGELRTETAYWGLPPDPHWSSGTVAIDSMAQVRLYIKTTDMNAMSSSRWSCRLEVTLNGPALGAQHGVYCLGDLLRPTMRRIAAAYFALMQPKPVDTLTTARMLKAQGKGSFLLRAALKERTGVAYGRTVSEGAFAGSDFPGALSFAPVPELTRRLLQAPADFDKKRRRAHSVAASAA